MKNNHCKPLRIVASKEGSSLVVVAVVMLVVSSIVATGMIRSQQSARLVKFSEVNADLRSAAEGELERCFFLWKKMKSGQFVNRDMVNTADASIPVNPTDEQIKAYLEVPPLASTRGYNPGFADVILGKPDDGRYLFDWKSTDINVKGLIAGSTAATSTRGDVSTYKLIVWASKDTLGGRKTVAVGRTFTVARSASFQKAIFYNGTIELTPGGTMTVDGDIAANADIFLGGRSATGMTIKGSVTGTSRLNLDTDFQNDIGYNIQGDTVTGVVPYFSPVFPSGRANQAARTAQAQSFLEGLDVASIQAAAPAQFPTPNDVYHSIIDPPFAGATEVTDPMYGQRMYNKAGLRFEVKESAGVPYVQVTSPSGVDYTTQFAPMFNPIPARNATANSPAVPAIPNPIRSQITDAREQAANPATPSQYQISVTTIDVGQLKSIIESIPALTDETTGFNGVLYVHDTGTAKAGIRLINGSDTPNVNDNGFTVATNTGLYVQGDYNTVVDANGKNNRTVVMADAVTGLSNNWTDERSNEPVVWDRPASSTTYNTAVITGDVGQTTGVDGSGRPVLLNSSGGPHNMIRFLENWQGQTYTLKGSIVQLFQSKIFNSNWVNQQDVYKLPGTRFINFDTNLADNPLRNFVSLVVAKRGDYFEPFETEKIRLTPSPTPSPTP